jgi:hypothetical protein
MNVLTLSSSNTPLSNASIWRFVVFMGIEIRDRVTWTL